MKSQKDLILEKDWNCLVVLDACRFDYFEEVYDEYFSGELQCAVSEGTSTDSWIKKTLKGENFGATIYISGNPAVNSMGVEAVEGFDAKNHFFKVVDVWDWGWDEKLGTVLPDQVRKATQMARAKHPSKRLISHFMQPHSPYLNSSRNLNLKKNFSRGKPRLGRVRKFAGKLLMGLLGTTRTWKIQRVLGLRTPTPIESFVEEMGEEALHKAYEENLRRVLAEIEEIVHSLPKKIVVTSDHGELLGEDGLYGHLDYCDSSVLKKVPYLEVKA